MKETHLFKRSAFEPTDKELNPKAADSDEEDPIESDDESDGGEVSRKGKGRAVKRSRGAYRGMDEDEEDSDDDMSDFIVEDDEDEEEKDERRAEKQKIRRLKGKRKAFVVLDSDEEIDEPEVQSVLLGRKSKAEMEAEALQKMPRFLPSTKMKYMMELIVKTFKERPDEKVRRRFEFRSYLCLLIFSCADPRRLSVDCLLEARLRLLGGERYCPRQVRRKHVSREARYIRSHLHVEGKGKDHVDVPQVWWCVDEFRSSHVSTY